MKIQVLDHGYVEFIEAWGSGKKGRDINNDSPGCDYSPRSDEDMECGIIEAARQSTQGSFRGWEPGICNCGPSKSEVWTLEEKPIHFPYCPANFKGDKILLKYLHSHAHSTPFEFAGMVIEIQAPLFVFREWHRHRTQSYNEMSARYSPLPDLYYDPERTVIIQRGRAAAGNKQAGAVTEFQESAVDAWRANLADFYRNAERLYQEALSIGIPKELARISIPVGHYSRMRASANLRNWLYFLSLRLDPAAQWEIRQFAEAVSQIIKQKFPKTFILFQETLTIHNAKT